jgi:hypothetical protein
VDEVNSVSAAWWDTLCLGFTLLLVAFAIGLFTWTILRLGWDIFWLSWPLMLFQHYMGWVEKTDLHDTHRYVPDTVRDVTSEELDSYYATEYPMEPILKSLEELTRSQPWKDVEVLTVRGCLIHKQPTWLPVECAPSGDVGYCSCFNKRLVQPIAACGDPTDYHVLGQVRGLLVVDATKEPNSRLLTHTIRLGKYRGPLEFLPQQFWGISVKRMAGAFFSVFTGLGSLMAKMSRLHIYEFDPNVIPFKVYERVAATVGNCTVRRDISEAVRDGRLSRTYVLSHMLSIGVGARVIDQGWGDIMKATRGGDVENLDFDFLFVDHGYPTAPPYIKVEEEEPPSPPDLGGDQDDNPKLKSVAEDLVAQVMKSSILSLNDAARSPACAEQLYLPSVEGLTFLDAKPTFQKFPVCQIPAVHGWIEEELPPKLGGERLTTFKLRENDTKQNKLGGVQIHTAFGIPPLKMDSDTATQLVAVGGRLCVEPPKVEKKIVVQGVTVETIGRKRLHWPRHLRIGDHDVDMTINKHFDGVEDNEENFKVCMSKMPHRSRERMCRMLGDVLGCVVEWDQNTRKMSIFIKGDDKVFKNKPRIIQFVNSVAWIRFVLKIGVILAKIKATPTCGWLDRHSETYFVWASGMTQKKLSAVATKLSLEGHKRIVFICGDDNTDLEGDADASKYDSTQRGVFFTRQMNLLELMGFSTDEIDCIEKIHASTRQGSGFSFKLNDLVLPSGAPWTLFLNTLGLVVFHRQLYEHRNTAVPTHEKVVNAARNLGLEMKYNYNPSLDGTALDGAEFLKGIFLHVKSKYVWVPCPSRMGKWAAVNYDHPNNRKDEKAFREHISQVTKGQDPFLLDPFCRIFVDAWKNLSAKKEILPEWQNVLGDHLSLTADEEGDYQAAWDRVYEARYGLSKARTAEMRQQLKEHALEPGMFKGADWASFAYRDYLGVART